MNSDTYLSIPDLKKVLIFVTEIFYIIFSSIYLTSKFIKGFVFCIEFCKFFKSFNFIEFNFQINIHIHTAKE